MVNFCDNSYQYNCSYQKEAEESRDKVVREKGGMFQSLSPYPGGRHQGSRIKG